MYSEYLMLAMVGIAALTDLSSRRIPNLLVAGGLIAALVLHLALPGGAGWKTWLLGMLTGFGLFLPFYLLRGMAAGDVKLMAAVGSFVGAMVAMKIALATFLIGGIWALAVILLKGRLRDTWFNLRTIMTPVFMRASGGAVEAAGMQKESVGRLPYGVAIALGTVAVTVFEFG